MSGGAGQTSFPVVGPFSLTRARQAWARMMLTTGRLRNRAKPPLPLPPASAGSSPSRGAGMATQQLLAEDSDHLPPLTMPSLATLRAGNPTYHHPYPSSPPHQEITLPSISALVETSTAAAERRHLSHVARRDHGELWSDHSPLYDPPGDIDHARDGWWSWILSAYPGGRAQRQQTVIDNIKYLCVSSLRQASPKRLLMLSAFRRGTSSTIFSTVELSSARCFLPMPACRSLRTSYSPCSPRSRLAATSTTQ